MSYNRTSPPSIDIWSTQDSFREIVDISLGQLCWFKA